MQSWGGTQIYSIAFIGGSKPVEVLLADSLYSKQVGGGFINTLIPNKNECRRYTIHFMQLLIFVNHVN